MGNQKRVTDMMLFFEHQIGFVCNSSNGHRAPRADYSHLNFVLHAENYIHRRLGQMFNIAHMLNEVAWFPENPASSR
jgi:hypothetical protein